MAENRNGEKYKRRIIACILCAFGIIALVIILMAGFFSAKDEREENDIAEDTEAVVESPVPKPQTAEPTNTAAISDEAESDIPQSATIIMVGDILLHTPVEEAAQDDETGEYNFDFIFEHSRDEISAADLALVNQEVIIGGKELGISGYPAFNAPYEIGDALVKAGFDVICHGTNHALDKGAKGIINTLDFWRESYPEIGVVGVYSEQEAYDEIYIREVNGIKVAILNYTYGTNGIPLPSDMPYAVSLLEENRVRSQLAEAESRADFTIVCPHWGIEYNLKTSADQKKWMEIFRECGADAVIGTHPHVIEPYVFYDDEDTESISNNHGNGDMLVYYSLGNFVNWTSGKGEGVANRMVGGMAHFIISRKESGEVSLDDYRVENYVCHVKSGDRNVTVYPLDEYTDELGAENEIIKQDAAFSKAYCEELCRRVYDDY